MQHLSTHAAVLHEINSLQIKPAVAADLLVVMAAGLLSVERNLRRY
jgi:hypothetical protein